MRKYELLLILNPDSTAEDKTALIADIKEELTSGQVKIAGEDDW